MDLMDLNHLLLVFSTILSLNCIGAVKDQAATAKPNIVFILADDLGYGDVSCYNENSKIQTPHIDQLASHGVRFIDAHTSSSVCTPTRYSILTGRYNWRSTLKKGVLSGYSKALIPLHRETIASFLQKNGYQTACIGKWHLGWNWSFKDKEKKLIDFSHRISNGPGSLGFNYFFGFCGSLDMPPYVWIEGDIPTMVPTKITPGSKGQAFWRAGPIADDFVHEQVLPTITEKAKQFIHSQSDKEDPFFLYFPLSAPHTPILPTKEFQGKSGLNNPYGDFVLMVDWVVGEITKQLEKDGLTNKTLVIFTSDNGCSPSADFKQLKSKGHNPSYVFRGTKADLFDGGHRVPFIVSYPPVVSPGISNQLVCTTDLFATVADLLDISYDDDVAEDSFSLLAALHLKSDAPKRQAVVHHSINGSFSIREGDWKAIFCPGSGGWSYPRPGRDTVAIRQLPDVQLYNLKKDSSEEDNLQAKHHEIVEKYRALLSGYVRNGRSTEGQPQRNDGPEKWPQLKWMTK